MRRAISSIFIAARGERISAVEAKHGAISHLLSSSMTVLNFDQLRLVVGGDDAVVDLLPKGGWKTTTTPTTD